MQLRDLAHSSRARRLSGSFALAILLLLAAAIVSGCGRPGPVEPAAAIPPPAQTPAGTATIPMLPTPAATLQQPWTPTPAATAAAPAPEPAATALDSLQATQVAALSPPTPEVIVTPTTQSLPTPSGHYSWTLKVPILMYHYISEPPADADIYRVDLSVSPDMFRQQMAWLRDNGYSTIDFYELTRAIVGHAELPEKPVLLSFDDGYLDNYDAAFPILQEYGFKGTFFIVTDFVDSGREGYMTWPMIEEMSRAGHRIESHSRTHPDLRDKSRDGLIWEILGSQQTIAAHIGYTPRYFCYPGGDYNADTIQMLRELDFWGATTTANDTWHGFNERFEWGRLRIRNNTTLQEFANVLDLEDTVRGKRP